MSGSHSYVRPHSIYVAKEIIYVGSRVGLLGITCDKRLDSGHCGLPFRPGDQLFSEGCVL